jgi:choline dehydrogenase-like flavoprotein
MDSNFKATCAEVHEQHTHTADFIERVRLNQTKLASELKPHYDFIVCGSDSSGSVMARRLAENPDVSVLLLEVGGSDDVPSVMEANQWPFNFGSEMTQRRLMSQSNRRLELMNLNSWVRATFPTNMWIWRPLGGILHQA